MTPGTRTEHAMGTAWRTWCKTVCICYGFLTCVGASAEHTAPLLPIDELVTPWSSFGIREYTFIGTWGETYKAAVWLRLMPTSGNYREARIVFQLTRSPALVSNSKTHLQDVTPKGFLLGGKLPEITFTAVATSRDRVERVVVKQQYWEQYATRESLGRTVNGRAVLKADTIYTLSMEGSQRLYQIPAFRSSKPSALFQAGDAWIGIVEDFMPDRSPKPFQFAVLQHLRYHLQLGFTGTLMVVVPETAALLLADAGVADAVKKQQLVLVLWEHGYEQGSNHMMQLPANNLLKTAMDGSSTTLGIWDLDEYLVLPSHRSISYEVNHGCLTQLHDPASQEAVLPFTLTTQQDSMPGPDITQWQQHGSFEAAVKSMKYAAQPVTRCDRGVFCKALINPNSDRDVHQLQRPAAAKGGRNVTDRSCAYMHHFHHLWGHRRWWSDTVLSETKAPLALADMPFKA